MACIAAAGCTGGHDVPTNAPSTTTVVAPQSSLQEAQEVMGYFNVALPTNARDVQVVKPPPERFRAKALVSFNAPREQVIQQTCAGFKQVFPNDRPPLINESYEGQILQYADVTINRDEYGFCSQYERGRKVLVLVPRTEGVTHVVLYHVPAR
ncbi:hypothetical protein [Mycolicibacterium houstonense]|uniref:hypothetical protein n=1 Tax=Mycolicibacterium houstonense TaxID=146021 RepID=UPI001359EFDB|nr:hypothetical protein [Mycolicibacterium houstonense]